MFNREVIEKLGYYVYRLIDPRNGETFYVGKGKGNRVFMHVTGTLSVLDSEDFSDEDVVSAKIKRIKEIQLHGHKVIHVIHRHGLTEDTAYEVEAALIDAYPGLTNSQIGKYSYDRGLMHYRQIIDMYQARPLEPRHKLIAISINHSADQSESVYEAVRYAWRLNPDKANSCDYVLAIHKGIVVGVFEADRWIDATAANFPGRSEDRPGRFGFHGSEASPDICALYIKTSPPRSSQNPIRYFDRPVLPSETALVGNVDNDGE